MADCNIMLLTREDARSTGWGREQVENWVTERNLAR